MYARMGIKVCSVIKFHLTTMTQPSDIVYSGFQKEVRRVPKEIH